MDTGSQLEGGAADIGVGIPEQRPPAKVSFFNFVRVQHLGSFVGAALRVERCGASGGLGAEVRTYPRSRIPVPFVSLSRLPYDNSKLCFRRGVNRVYGQICRRAAQNMLSPTPSGKRLIDGDACGP